MADVLDRRKQNYPSLILLAGLAVVLVIIPWVLPPYWKDVLVLFTMNVILVMSYRLITTMGGWSFAHIAIMGMGGYTMGFLTTKYYHWPFWTTVPLGGLAAALFALAISYPVLRTKRFYFFLSTYAAGEALRQVFLKFAKVTGGLDGIPFVPRPNPILSLHFESTINYYYLTLAFAIAIGLILYRLDNCRIGQTIKVISYNETLSEATGINTWGYKAMAFVIGSFFAGVVGTLFSSYNGFVNPEDLSSVFMMKIVASALIGGVGTFAGPIIGLLAVTLLHELFRSLNEWVPFLYGSCIIGVVLFLPNGLGSLLPKIYSFNHKKEKILKIEPEPGPVKVKRL